MAQSGVSTTISRRWRNKESYMEFTGSKCGNCGDRRIPARDVCPNCGNDKIIRDRVLERESRFATQPPVQSGS